MARDLDAIYNEVQMAISGIVHDNEYSMRSELENELIRLKGLLFFFSLKSSLK